MAGLEEAQEQVEQGGLSRTGGADKGHMATSRNADVYVDNRRCRCDGVSECDVTEFNVCSLVRQIMLRSFSAMSGHFGFAFAYVVDDLARE